ncbi:MAG: fumarylacetoacetate hydrolase, partial [Alphaproteobacteria bacterium]
MRLALDAASTLPQDGTAGTLIGRAWLPDEGPVPVAVRAEGVFDISALSPTTSGICALEDPAAKVRRAPGRRIGSAAEVIGNTGLDGRDPRRPWLLTPVDLHAVKACGVTFARSMLERVIESKAGGDAAAADGIRQTLSSAIGSDLSKVKPGSDAAMRLKAALIER